MDTVTPAKRSYVMSRVKGRDTSPERIVRRLVYHAGFRYRLCDPRLPGKPDLVFWGKRKVIFVHGCFWHGHEGCRRNRMPKSNQEYWFSKLEKTKSGILFIYQNYAKWAGRRWLSGSANLKKQIFFWKD